MMNNYKLILNQDTFLWVKNNEGLVYQSKNCRAFVFYLSDKLLEICRHLLELDHLYTVVLTKDELDNKDVCRFIDQLVNIEAGQFIQDTAGMETGSVSLMPVLKIQKNINDYILKHKQGIGGNIIQHIHELTFYINGSKFGSDRYYKQTIFPRKDALMLESEKIIRFIRNSKNNFLSNIYLVGNIFKYPKYEEFLNNIAEFEVSATICITANDFLIHKELLKMIDWHEKIKFNILIDQGIDIYQLKIILNDINISCLTTFMVFSEQNYFDFEPIQTSLNANIVPIYNGKNIDFFKSYVFIDHEDILQAALTKREVFVRQVTNTNHFGKLTLLPDGIVYADVNQTPIGTIDDTVYSIVYREFIEGKSWFKVRDCIPCKDCIYQWLCPSPSNYEIAIGRPNLCHVK